MGCGQHEINTISGRFSFPLIIFLIQDITLKKRFLSTMLNKKQIEDITFVSITTQMPRLPYFPSESMSVINILCHGHECNILFITVELLN